MKPSPLLVWTDRPRVEAEPHPSAWPCSRLSLWLSKQPVLFQTSPVVEGVPRPIRVPKGRRTESQSLPRVRLIRGWDKVPSRRSWCSGGRQRESKDGSQYRGKGEAGKAHLRGEKVPPAHARLVGHLQASAGPGENGKMMPASLHLWSVSSRPQPLRSLH